MFNNSFPACAFFFFFFLMDISLISLIVRSTALEEIDQKVFLSTTEKDRGIFVFLRVHAGEAVLNIDCREQTKF